MLNEVTNEIRDLVLRSRDAGGVIDVTAVARKLNIAYPDLEPRALMLLTLEMAGDLSANAQWD
jgi:hypothetical protein